MAKQSGAGIRRSQQQKTALAAGFSKPEARRMRDFTEARFSQTLRSRQQPEPISATQRGFRSPSNRIEREKSHKLEFQSDAWSTWSKSDKFPDWIRDTAEAINKAADGNLDKNDSYGWRAMYHHYVIEGLGEDDDFSDAAITFAEQYETIASA